MKLRETFGFEEVPNEHPDPRENDRVGRPNSEKVKKRPPKNLWFKDFNLWKQDLDLEHGGGYNLVADEDEEEIVATVGDKGLTLGRWHKRDNKGITFNSPRPMSIVASPKKNFKAYLTKT